MSAGLGGLFTAAWRDEMAREIAAWNESDRLPEEHPLVIGVGYREDGIIIETVCMAGEWMTVEEFDLRFGS